MLCIITEKIVLSHFELYCPDQTRNIGKAYLRCKNAWEAHERYGQALSNGSEEWKTDISPYQLRRKDVCNKFLRKPCGAQEVVRV